MKMCPPQFVLLLLLFDTGVKTVSYPDQLCHVQLSCMHSLSLGDHRAALLPSQCSPITSTGCQGQRADSMGLECGRVCVCVGGWQAICLHFIYHCCGAVNLHRCLSMTISLLVGLHLLFALSFLLPCPAACASYYKSL